MLTDSPRQIILHFHLFKNAGTSIDFNLRRIFGDQFLEVELGGPAELFTASQLVPLLEEKPEIRAVSSHTMTLPLPVRDDWQFLPIIILRHPLDRILSMYTYERAQDSDSPGAVMAKKWDFPDYVDARLSLPHDVVLRNWQTCWLARDRVDKDKYSTDDEVLFESASAVIEDLPFIGVVERFRESLDLLNRVLADRSMPAGFRVEQKNRSSLGVGSLSGRLDLIRNLIGEDLYRDLAKANALDLRLHQLALDTIGQRLAAAGKAR